MNVGILGLGLIGGSLARAYAKAEHTVYVYDQDESMVSFSQLAGIVHDILIPDTVSKCDLILLAIYTGASTTWLSENAQFIKPDALVIDCCGAKEQICHVGFSLAE